ncbi:MAG: thiamine pyrophosphate-binding protein [SAR202 cluster bacterium]|nr:thiamine pyrophosphate-binding protein [SAR202 cluster bacterium]
MPKTAKTTGSHILARVLLQEGVRYLFTLVGDHNLPLLDALNGLDIRLIDVRQEATAVHMADVWGRITGQPGVASYTTPGFANAIPGLATALHSESPVLSISGCAPLSELGRGAMQEIDQVGMAKPVTKGAWMVTDARHIPDAVALALRTAYTGRRGPVHLTVPVDIQEQVIAEDEVAFLDGSVHASLLPTPAPVERVRQAVELLHKAERPLIIAGSPAAYFDGGASLQRFIETTQTPLLTEADARGLVADDHPLCMGFYDAGLNRAARLLKEADTVLLLGRKHDLILGYAAHPAIHSDAKLIQVDPSPAEIGRNRAVAVGMAADIAAALDQLQAEAAERAWPARKPWLQRLKAERQAQAEWFDALAKPETPMHAAWVFKTLAPMLSPEDTLVFDGGDFCHFGRAALPARGPRRWWYFSPFGMLGQSMGTALAAKLARPEHRTVLVTGDGAFGFHAMEMDTAVRHSLPIVALVGNDSAWGIDRQIQLGIYGRTTASDLLPSRYDIVAKGLGAHGENIQSPEDLPGALERAFHLNRPAVVNVEVQRARSPRAEAAIARWKGSAAQPL